MIVVADTSGLHAAFDAEHDLHLECRRFVESELLALSPLVLTELDHLLRRDGGFDTVIQAMRALNDRLAAGQYLLANLTTAELAAAHAVRERYADLELDLADAAGVVLANRYETDRVLSLDQRDFRAITPLTQRFGAFRILPFDT